jgi:putative ABC transport system substrate-binding protein
VAVTDPVAASFVENLSRPGSNATGFSTGEYGTNAKWLELLKEIAPSITQVAVLQDPQNLSSLPQFAAIQSVAPSLGVELKSLPLRDVGEIERILAAFARGSNLGLIATRTQAANLRRDLIIALAARHRLPAVYPLRSPHRLPAVYPLRFPGAGQTGPGANCPDTMHGDHRPVAAATT